MSQYCGNPDDHEKLVREKIQEEDKQENLATGDARVITEELLIKLGYTDDEIERDLPFEVTSDKHKGTCAADFIIKLNGRRHMAIKCSMSLESRERHILAFCRAADEHVIPIAIITDGLAAHIINTVTGDLMARDKDSIPDRQEALIHLENNPPVKYPEDKRAIEKRILLAFETTMCPRPEEG